MKNIRSLLESSITENAIFARDRELWAVDNGNRGYEALSHYMSIMAQLSISTVPFLPPALLQKSVTPYDNLIFVLFILSLCVSIIFGLLERYVVVRFWEKEKTFLSELGSTWMLPRSKFTKTDSELRSSYLEAVEKDKELKAKRKSKSSEIWLILQMFFVALGVVLEVVLLIIKVK